MQKRQRERKSNQAIFEDAIFEVGLGIFGEDHEGSGLRRRVCSFFGKAFAFKGTHYILSKHLFKN